MLKGSRKERFIWLDIMLTLMTLELIAYFYYGVRALVLGGVCLVFCTAGDIISVRLMHRRFTADDLTCTSDALILALMLPAVMDLRIAAIAGLFAVIIAKNVFGGRSNMIFSPAAAAYVFISTSWEKQLLSYPEPHVKTGIFDTPEDLVYSASHFFNISGKMSHNDFEILLGNFSGPCGAVSILLLVVAAVILLLRRDISGGAFTGVISGTVLFAFLTPAAYSRYDSVRYTLVCNMVLFASVYIVADKRIAPERFFYAFFYGFFVGIFSYVIVLTTAEENAIIPVSLLFTPVALGLRNLERKIEFAYAEDTDKDSGSDAEQPDEADEKAAEYAPVSEEVLTEVHADGDTFIQEESDPDE